MSVVGRRVLGVEQNQPSSPAAASPSGGPAGAGTSSGGQALPAKALETSREQPWPVRVLSEKIAGYIERMPPVWVSGQMVEFKQRRGAWFTYVTLRDPDVDVSLPLTITRKVLESLPAEPAEGAEVVARVKAGFWQRRGSLSMEVSDLHLAGVGELLARIERLKKTLAAEGLFAESRKQPLPFLPKVVGLVCGRDSAAERDVVVTARTRWPGVRFEIRQVPVQGPPAAKAVAGAVAELDAIPEVEVIIIARGGGSLEDLLPFSDEGLVRAVAACSTPTVSAIGHEVDCPVLDWVADVRAVTPTDAGRRVVPAVAEEAAQLEAARDRLRRAVVHSVQRRRQETAQLRAHPALTARTQRLAHETELVASARGRLRRSVAIRVQRSGDEVAGLRGRLRALSPLSTLQRGYAVVAGSQGVVTSAGQVATGDALEVTLADGTIAASTTAVHENPGATTYPEKTARTLEPRAVSSEDPGAA